MTITADITNPPAPLYTFSRLNPTSAGNHAFLEEPDIAVSTQKMTVNWAAAFSGTVTVSVRTTGCGNPSDYYNVSIDVIPETIPSTTSSGVTKPDAFNLFLCDGRRTGTIPSCETTINTHPTQFFSTEAGSPNNYGSLNWQIIICLEVVLKKQPVQLTVEVSFVEQDYWEIPNTSYSSFMIQVLNPYY